jgi:prepilin-type N-terminal cleavage/methylation domain-containing protein
MKTIKGFTLIELLISISIIAILSVVLSVSFSNAQKNGRDQRRISDLKAIQNAAEQYYLLNNSNYPTATNIAWTGPAGQQILQKFPSGPKAGETYTRVTLTASSYCFCSLMEKSKNGNNENQICSGYNTVNCGMLPCYFCVGNQQ